MNGFISLLSSGAKAILTLEGQNTTCADVFYSWICIAYDLEQVLASPVIGVGNLQSEVVNIYNHQFNQMMKESSHHIYFLAYYLHPLFHQYEGIQLVMPPLSKDQALTKENYPTLFKLLLTSVLCIFQGKQLRTQDSGMEVVPILICQLIAYAYNQTLFQQAPLTRNTKPLKWRNQFAQDSNSNLLARVAIKIFSISPSEICDERTASRLGWFNAARRSSITPEHLISSAKLYDYYVNGFSEKGFKHSARVHLSTISEFPMNSAPSTFSAPTLMDLVNKDNVDPQLNSAALEHLWFNNPDPYD
uniref:Uncharacterized protein n=1 Tax=Psilocybe cubensis TaxID=181762 RepID=A0A8H7XL12_PSICU